MSGDDRSHKVTVAVWYSGGTKLGTLGHCGSSVHLGASDHSKFWSYRSAGPGMPSCGSRSLCLDASGHVYRPSCKVVGQVVLGHLVRLHGS